MIMPHWIASNPKNMNNLSYKKQINKVDISTDNRTYFLSSSELWLGIHFPDISLAAHRVSGADTCAVVEKQRGKVRVYRASPLAREQGIEAGMLLNSAYALCHQLQITQRDANREHALLQEYARTAMRFTPSIALAGTDTLLLEVKASLRLFGTLKHLYRQLKISFPVPHCIACAPAAEAAELMARQGIEKLVRSPERLQSALGEIGLSQAPLDNRLRQQLALCGLYHLRDLWRLPRPDLARRFGPGLLHYLDQLSGQRSVPQRLLELERPFMGAHDFVQETEDRAYLLRAAERLLGQAQRFLQQRASLSENICFRLLYSQHSGAAQKEYSLRVNAQQGGDRAEHFLPQLGEQLERLELEAPVVRIELRVEQYRPRTDTTRDLFKKRSSSVESWPALLDLLLARLGRRHVYRLRLVADHRPEKAWMKYPLQHTACTNKLDTVPGRRPTWLLSQPVACLGSRFSLLSDAERLESGWWDGEDSRREYYRALAPSGRHCWLYRDLQAANEQWYMHGLFA